MPKPRIYGHQTASQAPRNESRYEFTSKNGGGLITLTETDDGLTVDLTRLDATVTVRTSQDGPLPAPAPEPKPIRVDTRTELIALAKRLGMRHDWHEPDEKDVSATVAGTHLDNAGHWPTDVNGEPGIEYHVILTKDGDDGPLRYAVNLATLLAWATGYEG